MGESTVGKTAICHQLSSDGTDFPKNYITTSLCDVLVKAVKIPDTNDLVELFLMDSSGNEMYHEILKDVWKQANLIVAVYDVTREESFGNVSKASTTVVIRKLRLNFKFPDKIEMDDLTNPNSF